MRRNLLSCARGWAIGAAALALVACGGGGSVDDVAPDLDTGGDVPVTTCQVDDDCKAETGGNPCLKATCDKVEGVCFTGADPAAEGAACDDGAPCTTGDTCHAGECGGEAKACDDANPCTADGCDAGSGQCTFDDLPNGTSCDDGEVCTSGDKCQAGVCNAGANTCACTIDADCSEWEDGDLCNGSLQCRDDHTCGVDPATVVTCDPTGDSDCVQARCSPTTGACAPVNVNEAGACQPADLCLEGGHCATGACLGGAARACDDGDACTVDSCEVATGDCQHVAAASGSSCDDGVDCTHGEACDAQGDCVPAAIDACDDGNPCTDDTCDTVLGGCSHASSAPGTPCDDHNACTTGDACNAAHACVAAAQVVCTDGNSCTANVCDPQTGVCSFPAVATGTPCDDGDPCTLSDACDADGGCKPGAVKVCDDHNACTADACDPTTGACGFAPLDVGSPCTDDNACTKGDACDDHGACQPGVDFTRRSVGEGGCDDAQSCTTDACNPDDGLCSNVPVEVGTPCTDENACTKGDACDDHGACQPGADYTRRSLGEGGCDDGEECTADTCNPVTGACLHDPVDDGTACSDDDGCTLNDACQAGACQLSTLKDCDDHQACTTDSCRSSDGACVHDGAPHEAEICTHADTCRADTRCHEGACAGGVAVPECCHVDGDCATGEGCQSVACVGETCQYQAQVCPGESAGCSMKLCDVGVGCAGVAVSLAGRVVVAERRFADEVGTVRLRSDPVGAFSVTDQGLSLAGATAADLFLKPLRLPRGTTTLRVRAQAPAASIEAAKLALVDRTDGSELPGTLVDLEPDAAFEVIYDVSAPTDRTASFRLQVKDPTWTLESVQAVHHGAQGCPNAAGPEGIEWLDVAGTAQQVTACESAAGAKLVVWTEPGSTKTRLVWRFWDGAAWSDEKTAGGEFDPQPEFTVACLASDFGWAIVLGATAQDGFVAARMVVLDDAGTAKSSQFVSHVAGDHTETPALAVLPNGDLLVAFTSDLVDGDGLGVALSRFAPDGTPVGAANVKVNEITNGTQHRPTLAVSGTRVFVAWESKVSTDKATLRRRVFDLDLLPQTSDNAFATSTDVEYLHPSATPIAAEQGAFLVAYEAHGKPADEGAGVYWSLFSLDGTETRNEEALAYGKANLQEGPVAFPVPGGAMVSWRSDHATQYVVDLMTARFDAVGVQGNARILGGIANNGPALSAAPGALDHVVIKDGKVGLARLGLACDKGLFACDVSPVEVCVDADTYLTLVDGCLGLSCSEVCP